MLERLDHVRVGASDPAAAAADYARLLAVPAEPSTRCEGAWQLQIGATGLLLVPVGEGAEGMQALVFAGAHEAPVETETRGITIEVDPACPLPVPPQRSLSPGAQRLDHAVVLTTDHEAALRLYGDRMGLRLALDRSFPQRGVRILFFRLDGVTIEVAGPLDPPSGSPTDRFGGLAWQGADLVSWHDRLGSEGFAVSPHRAGHKAGTRVCTVLEGTSGVPTLLIGPDAEGA